MNVARTFSLMRMDDSNAPSCRAYVRLVGLKGPNK